MDFTSNDKEPERPLTRREIREQQRQREREQAESELAAGAGADADEPEQTPEPVANAEPASRAEAAASAEPAPEGAPERTAMAFDDAVRPDASGSESADPFDTIFNDAIDGVGEDAPPSEVTMARAAKRKKRRRGGCLIIALVVIAALVGGGLFVWNQFGDRITDYLGITQTDYEGEGNGTEVEFTILPGDTGTSIGQRLQEQGVVLTADAFVSSILAMPAEPTFIPGTYVLQEEMSAASAVVALTDEKNRVEASVTIPEGTIMRDVFTLVEESTGIPVADLEAAAADPQSFGLPAQAQSLEGFLFPATYIFAPDDTAETVLTTMVDRTYESLASHGVPEQDVWDVIRLASLIEKEARFEEDFYKVSRVFLNRIDINMPLQSDATVTYGTGKYDRAATTDSERGDASNEYNTYEHNGMVIRPISNPGDLAIDAAMHPADGPWLYFVTVNLETGETVFSETYDQHQAAVDEWLKWLEENPDYG
ncbi:endolytic transglycosylase MltG [Gulosibacter molinativorax]|nr:endolytic transglycosylase MltG [Gulosibacter molinativorax]QUY61416.1 Aminodeoxychorismate lyase [Gulosibacter molinativorax]